MCFKSTEKESKSVRVKFHTLEKNGLEETTVPILA